MQTDATRTEKDIAQSECFDAQLAGIDADGASHYWSQYFETVIVIEDCDTELFELDETPCRKLADWRDHVANQRGWADCRIGGSLLGDLAAGMEAAQ